MKNLLFAVVFIGYLTATSISATVFLQWVWHYAIPKCRRAVLRIITKKVTSGYE